MMVFFLFAPPTRAGCARTILGGVVAVVVMGGAGLAAALSVDSVREFFLQRAAVQQDYDGGPNGRFGNQMRSIPMLVEMPNGMGPLRFRLTFGLEPHNSYVNAFASNGWLGGFAFIALALSTSFIGFRLCLTPSPLDAAGADRLSRHPRVLRAGFSDRHRPLAHVLLDAWCGLGAGGGAAALAGAGWRRHGPRPPRSCGGRGAGVTKRRLADFA